MMTSSLTRELEAPQDLIGFTKDWARRILVAYNEKIDPEWLLGSVLRVLMVSAKENPHPGMLSNSYVVEVTYTQGNDDISVESWFVKVPKTEATGNVDEKEVFMYQKMFPTLQDYAERTSKNNNDIQMPIPLVFHACFSENFPARNHVVLENLRDQSFKPLRPETCGLVFVRAAMTSLATVHATVFGYQNVLGGRSSFLERFPLIREDWIPRFAEIKEVVGSLLAPYLTYMSKVQPDISPQMAILTKFQKFLLPVYADLCRSPELDPLKILVHGDSKIDNFMFKKLTWSLEDAYDAIIVDWQGVGYDYLSSDLMWTLYGFMKNLPDKNATVDTFLDYAITYYHEELLRLLKLLKVDPDRLKIPLDEYDICALVRKGFVHNYLKVAIIKPLLTIQNPEQLISWYRSVQRGGAEVVESHLASDHIPLPREEDVFRTGSSFVNFVHLYMVIAAEIGVFHDLGPMCISMMKDAMFSGPDILEKVLEEADHYRFSTSGLEPVEDVQDQMGYVLEELESEKCPEGDECAPAGGNIAINGDIASADEFPKDNHSETTSEGLHDSTIENRTDAGNSGINCIATDDQATLETEAVNAVTGMLQSSTHKVCKPPEVSAGADEQVEILSMSSDAKDQEVEVISAIVFVKTDRPVEEAAAVSTVEECITISRPSSHNSQVKPSRNTEPLEHLAATIRGLSNSSLRQQKQGKVPPARRSTRIKAVEEKIEELKIEMMKAKDSIIELTGMVKDFYKEDFDAVTPPADHDADPQILLQELPEGSGILYCQEESEPDSFQTAAGSPDGSCCCCSAGLVPKDDYQATEETVCDRQCQTDSDSTVSIKKQNFEEPPNGKVAEHDNAKGLMEDSTGPPDQVLSGSDPGPSDCQVEIHGQQSMQTQQGGPVMRRLTSSERQESLLEDPVQRSLEDLREAVHTFYQVCLQELYDL